MGPGGRGNAFGLPGTVLMRVLLNALQAGNRSGTGRYTTELVSALTRLDVAIELTVLWPGNVCRGAVEGAVRWIERGNGKAARIIADQWGVPWRFGAKDSLLHYPANVGPALYAPNVVLTVHDLSFFHHPEWFRWSRAVYYRHAVRMSARRARRVIADSHATARDLVRFAGVDEGRIDVVPLGVNAAFSPRGEEACDQVRRTYGLPERFFVYLGTHEPRKNLPRLIAAWSRMAEDGGPDLVIAGRAGWKTGAIAEAVRDSPHRARIHFPGFIPNQAVPALLSAAEAFVWPSLFEGFGLPPLEAMACGTPVLTSKSSSLPEVVGNAAVLVDPTDIEAMSAAMAELARDAARRDELRRRGLERAAEFTWEKTARLTYESYCRAMEA